MSGKKKGIRESDRQQTRLAVPPLAHWVFAVFGAIAVLWTIGGLFARARTWGFSHAAYLPPFVTLTIVVMALLVLWQPFRAQLLRLAVGFHDVFAGGSRVVHMILGAAISIGVGVVMYVNPIPASLLGDGYFYLTELGRVSDGAPIKYFSYHSLIAPLLFFEFGLVLKAWFHLTQADAVFRILTACLGVTYVGGLLWYTTRAARDAWSALTLGTLVLGCGALLFFFGYIEFYAPLAVAAVCFAISLYTAVSRNTSLRSPALWFLVAMCCHFSAICMLPALIWSIAERRLAARGAVLSTSRFLAILLVVVVLGATVYVLDAVLHVVDLTQLVLIPFRETAEQGKYTLLSEAHLLDLPNIVLLPGGIAPIIILVLSTGIAGRVRWELPTIRTFAVLVLCWLLVAVFFNPLYGLARDWDIFAPLGIAMALLAFAMLESIELPSEQRRHVAVALAVFSILMSFSWIALNTDIRAAVPRYKDMLSRDEATLHPDFTEYGYLNLDKFYFGVGDYAGSAHALRRAVEARAYPWDFARFTMLLHGVRDKNAVLPDIDAVVGLLLRKSADSLLLATSQDATTQDSTEYVADQLVRLCMEGSAVPFTSERLRSFSRVDSLLPHAAIISLLRGTLPSSDITAFRAVMQQYEGRRHLGKPVLSTYLRKLAYLRFGNHYASQSQFDSCAVWYAQYYASDSSNVRMVINYLSVSMEQRDQTTADRLLHRVRTLEPENPETQYYEALYLLVFRKDDAGAKAQLELFLARSNDRALRAHAEELLRRIGSR
ncbi:MAG: hypothetical protein IPP94_06870 [Ignavibacteria bacterium]|nr:hypothetical protein [Ignavibacteria bacterium]